MNNQSCDRSTKYDIEIGEFKFTICERSIAVVDLTYSPRFIGREGFALSLAEAQRLARVYCNIIDLGIEYAGSNDTPENMQEYRTRLKGELPELLRQVAEIEAQTIFPLHPDTIRAMQIIKLEAARQNPPVSTRRSRRFGYAYILRSSTGYYKIGRTVNPEDRQRTFSVKLPFSVRYDLVIPSPDYIGFENYLHQHYRDKRVDGEWFALTADDLNLLKEAYGDA